MNHYSHFVGALFKNMGDRTLNLLHAAVGLAGEGGELLDCVKKAWAYEKPLDEANLKEEAGDALFYIQALCNEMGWSLEDIASANISKLEKRYPGGKYSNEAARARLDKIAEVNAIEASLTLELSKV